jgi:hypothetical protein
MVSKQQTNFAFVCGAFAVCFHWSFRETCGSFRRSTERQTQTERYLRERERFERKNIAVGLRVW